ncbi:hypothetical protein EVAR_23190_1 [Eumeta japonica]|uniref:Uncharacterized protein n=1 Tax=Eumeta variegata TaxID=151549 RepID=A0A4C1VCL6_EUMVA|nr:hypothetical protein EVAR_23190_1 [Eumeta japonica]
MSGRGGIEILTSGIFIAAVDAPRRRRDRRRAGRRNGRYDRRNNCTKAIESVLLRLQNYVRVGSFAAARLGLTNRYGDAFAGSTLASSYAAIHIAFAPMSYVNRRRVLLLRCLLTLCDLFGHVTAARANTES